MTNAVSLSVCQNIRFRLRSLTTDDEKEKLQPRCHTVATTMATVARGKATRFLTAFMRTRQLLCVGSAACANLMSLISLPLDSAHGQPSSFSSPLTQTSAFATLVRGAQDESDYSESNVMEVLKELVSRKEAPLGSSKSSAGSSALARLSLKELCSRLCIGYRKLPDLSSLGEGEKETILKYLSMKCFPSDEQVSEAVKRYQNHLPTQGENNVRRHAQIQLMSRLRKACTPLYERLFHCVLEEDVGKGMGFTVCLRKDLREWIKRRDGAPHAKDDLTMLHMKQLDTYLRHLLSTWFSPGMLELRRIAYNTTSADIIEALAMKEAVHPIKSLDDLRQRLGPDRRVYGAFHPLLPEEPLVFCHVALRSFIPNSMNQVRPTIVQEHPSVSAFYSIFSTHSGLGGIELGRYVIKGAVKLMREEFPSLETFCTLSPIPQFRSWLEEKMVHSQQGTFQDDSLLTEKEIERLQTLLGCVRSEVPEMLLQKLQETPEMEVEFAMTIKPILLRWAARYLVVEKHRGKPLDGVARFHIANGAEMYRLNFLADTSRKGWHNSFGVMVNYRYHLDDVEENQARHEKDFDIPVCEGISQWL